jgi:hypothetical protein
LKQYLFDVTLTFTKLHQRYLAKIEASNDVFVLYRIWDGLSKCTFFILTFA